jgi:hypothetical protein
MGQFKNIIEKKYVVDMSDCTVALAGVAAARIW